MMSLCFSLLGSGRFPPEMEEYIEAEVRRRLDERLLRGVTLRLSDVPDAPAGYRMLGMFLLGKSVVYRYNVYFIYGVIVFSRRGRLVVAPFFI